MTVLAGHAEEIGVNERKLNIKQASAYSGFPTRAIARAAKAEPPRLRGFKTSEFGPWFFSESDLDVWVAAMDNTEVAQKENV